MLYLPLMAWNLDAVYIKKDKDIIRPPYTEPD